MRYSNLFFTLFIIFFLSSTFTTAQEQLGLKLENYSGINSVLLNPTNQLTSPLKWNINIASAGFFFDNNYAYFEDASIFTILRNTEDIQTRPDIDLENQDPNDFLIVDFYSGNRKKQGSALTTIMGPSFMVNLESGWSFGLFTNYRTALSARKIPSSLNYYSFNQREVLENFSISPFKAAGMAWGELGFNLAKRIETASGTIGLGINAKYLNGNEALFFNNNTTFDLTRLEEDSLHFQNLEISYGLTNSIDSEEDYQLQKNGSGLGIDIGFTYIDGYSENDYNWKVGASIIDIGRINFKTNAEQHSIEVRDPFTIATNDYNDLSSISDQSLLLSLQVLDDSLASLDQNQFNVGLPTAFTAYGDYHLTEHIYLNALFVQSIPLAENGVVRDNLLALSPRFEHQWFGAMMPISLLNYRKLRVGLSARIAFLTIGTEDLGSMFRQNELTGSDFYIGLRFNPWDIGWDIGNGGGLFGGGKKEGCYF